jgi:hypothetical protein
LWNLTPQEAWSGRKPSVFHLRVFGSIAYTHVPDQSRSKLDDKSEKFVFVGYDASSKGYKLYNPNKGKIVISRDVQFDEEGSWNWDTQEKDYNFFPIWEEEEDVQTQEEEQHTPPATPPHTPPPSPPQIQDESATRTGPQGKKNLDEIYEVALPVDDLSLFCLFVECEPIRFEAV